MKKLLHKIKSRNPEPQTSSRITNDTVVEHREQILAGGRRFKYPVQYARHRLVFNAIIISVVALIVVVLVGWWQLYPAQNTSEFMYRVTKVIPVPVAKVDGQFVLYSDYLMKYRSSIYYLEKGEHVSLKTDDGKRQVEYIKQQAMQDSIADAYAQKLANQMGLSVSDVELEAFLKQQRQTIDGETLEQTYYSTIEDYYNWSPSEYRHVMRSKLLRQKVAYTIDKDAQAMVDQIADRLSKDSKISLKDLASSLSGGDDSKVTYGASGMVPKSNHDGGLALAASRLQKQQISSVVKTTSGDGYYFVRLLDSNQTQISYEYIKVPLNEFNQQMDRVTSNNLIEEYIDVPKSTTLTKEG